MPIHLRAEPGDYAPAVLLPGDPLRARWIADSSWSRPAGQRRTRPVGIHRLVDGTPVSVQATGMGCPSAAIVIEELIQLGCTRLIRVGTCGALRPQLAWET